MIIVDSKRTVRLTVADLPFNGYVEPGQTQLKYENSLTFACPGCGRIGSIPTGKPGWEIIVAELEIMTLSPSIHCVGCCGWHGYLRDGIYQSC